MKNLFTTFLLVALFVAPCFSQNGDRLEAWAENIAYKAERLAERVARDVERNAESIEEIAVELAEDIEETFDETDFNINIDVWTNKGEYYSHSKAYLGIHSDHISKRKAEKLGFQNRFGSYVTKVIANSAADKAGLQPFDYIYGVGEQRTSNNQDLSDILDDYEPGELVEIFYVRDGRKISTKVELGEYDDFDWSNQSEEDPFLGVTKNHAEDSDDMDGVTVNVVNGSSANDMGMKDGDVIKSIGGRPVLDWSDMSIAIDNLEVGKEATIIVERNGSERTLRGQVDTKRNNQGSNTYSNNGSWNWNDDEDDWKGGGGAFLGIYIEDISERKAEALGFDNPYGSYVSSIIKGTAADRAGLMPLDYVFGIDEYRVGDEQSLGGILRKYEAGDDAIVHFYRKGNRNKKEIVFREKRDYNKEHKDKCEDPFLGIVKTEKRHGEKGVKINPVNNSTAEEIGLDDGDLITHINGYQMYDWTDIGIAIDMLSPGDKIEVTYDRDGREKTASGKIQSYADAKNCSNCDCNDRNITIINTDDVQIRIPNRFNKRGDWDRNRDRDDYDDMDDISVNMQGVSNEEARNLESKGINMDISDDLRIENLNLGPNPNIGMFELEFDLETEGQTRVNVYNPAGRSIYEYDLGRFSGDFSDNIDISQNGAGTYFLQIAQDGKSFVRKVVLTKN